MKYVSEKYIKKKLEEFMWKGQWEKNEEKTKRIDVKYDSERKMKKKLKELMWNMTERDTWRKN